MPWETTENEFRNRIKNPDVFREGTFRTISLKGVSGVSLILGKLKPDKVSEGKDANSMVAQAIRFSKDNWTLATAKTWFAEHSTEFRGDQKMETKRVNRYDVTELEHTKITAQGYLQTDGLLTKTGIFVYHKEDGSERRELRLAEEVFDEQSMKSFGNLAVTDGHPGETLDARNTYRFQIGHTFPEVKKEGNHLRTSLLITDERAIKKIEAGKQQLSNGYDCDLEYSSGELSNGQHYDAIQRNIRGNHVAIVNKARGGPSVRLTLDSEDNADIPKWDSDSNTNKQDSKSEPKEKKTMVKLKFDGIETEVEAGAASIVSAAMDKRDSRIKQLELEVTQKQTDFDVLQAKLDSAEAKVKEAEGSKLDEDAIAKLVNDRANEKVILLAAAKTLLAEEQVEKLDTMSDKEIRLAVIKADPVLKEINLDEKSDDYVSALFVGAVENAKGRKEKTDTQTKAVDNTRNSGKKSDDQADAGKARQDMMDKIANKSRGIVAEGKEAN